MHPQQADRRDKPGRRVDRADGCAAPQRDFDRLEKEAAGKSMKRVQPREVPSPTRAEQ